MRDKQIVQVDNYTRLCLSAIAVLLTVLVVMMWVQAVPEPPSASAAEPFLDTAAVRNSQLEAQKETNVKLGELIELNTLSQPVVRQGGDAARLLLDMIGGTAEATPPEGLIYPTVLVVRRSTGPPPEPER